jgi:hypothetical protein
MEEHQMPKKIDHNAIKDGEFVFEGKVVPHEKTLDEMIEDMKNFEEKGDANLHKPQLWEEINKMVFPADRWRIKNLIPREGIVILAAVSGEKKSWVAMSMAQCIASGINFLGNPLFETLPGKVLFIDGESSTSEFQRRGRQLGFDSAGDNLLILNKELNFYKDTEEDIDWL